MTKRRRVIVLGYADECDREGEVDLRARRIVETCGDLEIEALKDLDDLGLWLTYKTEDGRKLSKKDALSHLGGH